VSSGQIKSDTRSHAAMRQSINQSTAEWLQATLQKNESRTQKAVSIQNSGADQARSDSKYMLNVVVFVGVVCVPLSSATSRRRTQAATYIRHE